MLPCTVLAIPVVLDPSIPHLEHGLASIMSPQALNRVRVEPIGKFEGTGVSFQQPHSFPEPKPSWYSGPMSSYGATSSSNGSGLPFERRLGFFPESPEPSYLGPAFRGTGTAGPHERSYMMNMCVRGLALSSNSSISGNMPDDASPGLAMLPSQRLTITSRDPQLLYLKSWVTVGVPGV